MIDKDARLLCDKRYDIVERGHTQIWDTIQVMNNRLRNQQDQIISLQGQVKTLTDKVFPRCGECGQVIPPRRLIGDPPRDLMNDTFGLAGSAEQPKENKEYNAPPSQLR